MSPKKLLPKLLLGAALITLAACTQATVVAPPTPTSTSKVERRAIVLGDISDDPGEVIEGTQPLADYLASQLSEYGITEGQVRIAASADEMTALLKNGEVDLYFDSVYPATRIGDASGAQPILRRWRFSVETYQTVIFASKESGISSLDELPGHIIAFDNQYSTSGYLLPAVYLVEHGLDLVGKRTFNEPVSDQQVGFVFSFDDENTLQWVLGGLVAAGATDDYHFSDDFLKKAKDQLIELARTEPVPRQVVVARPGIDPALLEAIKTILIDADTTDAGMAALEPFQTSQFDDFPEGIEAAQERMRAMMEIVQDLPLP